METMTRLVVLSAAGFFFFAAAALAGDLGAELGQAQSYAGLAVTAKDIRDARLHMHQAINCLVGPSGDGFDGKQITPCSDSGGGAIPDEPDQVKKVRLMLAKDQLQTGLAAEDLRAAQSAAASAQATLLSIRGSEL